MKCPSAAMAKSLHTTNDAFAPVKARCRPPRSRCPTTFKCRLSRNLRRNRQTNWPQGIATLSGTTRAGQHNCRRSGRNITANGDPLFGLNRVTVGQPALRSTGPPISVPALQALAQCARCNPDVADYRWSACAATAYADESTGSPQELLQQQQAVQQKLQQLQAATASNLRRR